MGKFVVKTGKDNQFRFSLRAGNGQTILTSEAYTTKAACNNGIASVKTNSQDDSRYERKTSTNGKQLFNLRAGNGQVIGTSELYESAAAMENGIASVKKNAPDAEISEE
ncbi:YegP family protein [Arachidicoccus terrestris]|jgi:uncharacterized protein YegP (UPF0339 family)|uniref:YegP family protein n=1 Tax=Arachidicoccus terrestris TaxID=2875539 RepID=UPI001CC49522|nr:YegP family protein [Arachidicoccus terrestris]UAY54199.1 YegP family protein [Arachidicoccus terrestris]